MNTTTGAFVLSARSRRKSRSTLAVQRSLGGVAITSVVLGCAWTVYSNVIGASIYPSMQRAAFDAPIAKSSAPVARSSSRAFDEVFAALDPLSKPETISPSIMFNERFAAAAPQGQPSRVAEASPLIDSSTLAAASRAASAPKLAEAVKKSDPAKLAEGPKKDGSATAPSRLALNVPASRPAEEKLADAPSAKAPGDTFRDMAQRAKAAVMSLASGEKQNMVEKLWGKQPAQGPLLAFASADASVTGSLSEDYGKKQNPMLGGSPPYDRQTAVYDISAAKVYLPDGTTLEAHSGLGSKLDDVRYSHVRMQGVTPPHIYELTPREALFHGVPALRLTPIGGDDAIFGRSGLLAHTYMLGPNGDSNGCVSFKDYSAFLDAYKNKGIKRLAVVASVH